MDKQEYKKLVDKKSKNPYILDNILMSFLVGGTLGALFHVIVTWFMEMFNVKSDIAISFTLINFIIIAIVLTGFGVFDTLISKFKFGLIIPITGFAHSVSSSLLDYRKDGLITGLGSNLFKLAGCVILYGTFSAFILTIIKVIIYG